MCLFVDLVRGIIGLLDVRRKVKGERRKKKEERRKEKGESRRVKVVHQKNQLND